MLEIVQTFMTREFPRLNAYHDYYIGNQDINKKWYEDASKPCNRATTNFCSYITDSYAGYLTGKDITYTSIDDIAPIQQVLNYNDVAVNDAEFMKNLLMFGVAGEIMWIDSDKQIRFKTIDSREFIPIYSNTLDKDLLYVIRVYPEDTVNEIMKRDYVVELYTKFAVFRYKSNNGFSQLTLIDDYPHYFGQVPFNIAYLDADEKNIFDNIISLQDIYNKLLSAEIDDYEAFVNSYMVLNNIDVDEESLASMKTNRVLVVGEGGSVSYLTKDFSSAQIDAILDNLKSSIHKISNCPDFTDSSFGTSTGIALKMKLIGFEDKASRIEKQMTKALQRRIELICAIQTLVGEDAWIDVQIIWTRNLPVDYSEIITTVNGLRGIVSDKTLLAQVPFVQDIDDELDAIQEQKRSNMDLYTFPSVGEDE